MPRADLREILKNARRERNLPLIMGVINVTPDSFSGDGLLSGTTSLLDHALRLIDSGAQILDIGAESTRPGSRPVSADEERSRLFPAIKALAEIPVPLSIDTRRPGIFREAMDFGATLINDVGGLRDPGFHTILQENPEIMAVVMHMQGTPETMQRDPFYEDVVSEVYHFFSERSQMLERSGIHRDRLIFDPGLGFGKTTDHNFLLLRHMNSFLEMGPLLIAPSRKRFLDDRDHPKAPEDRDIPTAAVMAWSTLHGASLFRTHRPDIAVQIRRVLRSIAGEDHA